MNLCKNFLVLLFCSLFWFLPSKALNFLSVFNNHEKINATEDCSRVKINKLLDKNKLNYNSQMSLASLCQESPEECKNKGLFFKLNPNLILQNGEHVLRVFMKLVQQGHLEIRALILEALEQKNLAPHAVGKGNGDFALDILQTSDRELWRLLLGHKNFNPNNRYGSQLVPLATELIKSRNYEAVHCIFTHPRFSNEMVDSDSRRPGYYILEYYKNGADRKLFLAFMGNNVAAWKLRGLGLCDARKFDIFFRRIMRVDESRLMLFKKYVESLLVWHEVDQPEKNAWIPIKKWFDSERLEGKIYINNYFTQGALGVLTHYGIAREKVVNNIDLMKLWSIRRPADLQSISLANLLAVYKTHQVKHEGICSLCLGAAQIWYKTSVWCDHIFDQQCLLAYLLSADPNKDLLCPSRNCPVSIPPSLYLALSSDIIKDDAAFKRLEQAYKERLSYHEARRKEIGESVPNLLQCSSCERPFIYENSLTRYRRVTCPGCKTPRVLDVENNQNPFTVNNARGEWGQCSSCKAVVEKIDGCNNIACPNCRKVTSFIRFK